MPRPCHRALTCLLATVLYNACPVSAEELRPVALRARVDRVQPMTGIVLWSTNEHVDTAPIQLEFAYLSYADVAIGPGRYDWSAIERLLGAAARRGHQMILRFHDTYVGKPTGVPEFISAASGYRGTRGLSEGKPTEFPDWSSDALQRFVLEFFGELAGRYDADPRLAFLQVGFGLWAEYHIDDGPMELGKTFPSKAYQERFLEHLDNSFRATPWMISVDAAQRHTPLAGNTRLLRRGFGLFDDSLNHRRHDRWNLPNWETLGRDRWRRAPCGGEFSFFEAADQRLALDPGGPHGIPFPELAAKFHITFVIGDDQPRLQPAERISRAGLATGYRFRITRFLSAPGRSSVEVENRGIAPIYHDAFVAVDGVRAQASLKRLLPGERREFAIRAGGDAATLTIQSDRLVPGQQIGFDADLDAS